MPGAEAKPLAGKVALVTGAAKRLGKASALAMVRAGANVAITFLHSEKEASRIVKELEPVALGTSAVKYLQKTKQGTELGANKSSARILAVRCDVADPESVRAAINTVVQKFGGIDILVNNAGNYETAEFKDLTLENWDAIFATNV